MFARKYRPQTISNLDNTHIRETLGKALLENKWSQSYLLTGPRGTGKTTTARLIAKIVNCTDRKLGEEPCNKCESCVSISNGSNLDVIEVDAASNRGIDEVRDLREKVKLSPSSLKYKVYIIDEVHMMTTEAFNALLKTLEEPPSHVIFVLATTELHKVPATIVSRCQHFEFGQSLSSEIISSLSKIVKEEGLETENGVLEKISSLAGGSFRDAHKILDQVASLDKKITKELLEQFSPSTQSDEIVEILTAIFSKDQKKALEMVEIQVSKGHKVSQMLEAMVDFLRKQLLAYSEVKQDVSVITGIEINDISRLLVLLVEANSMLRDSPVLQVPLEIAICEFIGNEKSRNFSTQIRTTEKIAETANHKEIKEESKSPPKANEEVVSLSVSEEDIEPIVELAQDIDIEESQAEPEIKLQSVGEVSIDEVKAKWDQILIAAKPFNHSLAAFLKAAKPSSVNGAEVVVEVLYKFHKEKLEEKKNRDVVEKVISDIMGKDLKIKLILEGNK